MINYSQPDFYRFNSDSIELVKWVASKNLNVRKLLDLGSGCGVLALEYHQLQPVQLMALVEVQEEFLGHLKKNSEGTPAAIYHMSFSEFHPTEAFDLILCNPPYYLPGAGEPSLDPCRHIARSFVRDNWAQLLKCVERSLSPKGQCFMVIKEDKILKEMILKNTFLNITFHQVQKGLLFLELSRLDVERA